MSLEQIRSTATNDWQKARAALLVKEKQLTKLQDELAAERRRLPRVLVEKQYRFDGPSGPITLGELFAGRPQLLLYHFMFAPTVGGWPDAACPGCSMFIDNLGEFATTHLERRDVSFATVSLAPMENIERYRRRMGWNINWVSSADNSFNRDFGLTTDQGEQHGLSVFLKDNGAIYWTYFTSARGLEKVGTLWSLLDLVPYGRQEEWEDSPSGTPQSPAYQWWRRHDEY
ncbi:MAG TPA: DUF899 domain-containing protein [Steroidobacteraceae bacterium]|nr:DUF899 domain-containing protein [Steroidobacteraceae bacterium]